MEHLEIDGNKVIRFIQPDNWHVHLREFSQLEHTVQYSAKQFQRILAMPNTVEPLAKVSDVISYQSAVRKYGRALQSEFNPFVALYLTDHTTSDDIQKARDEGIIAAKLYPMGATTQSDRGVTSIEKIYSVLDAMQESNMVLSIHCEVTDTDVDFFDRERVFVDRYLADLRSRFPMLRIVVEHVSTVEAVQFVIFADPPIAATVTPQHLLANRNMLFSKGLMPSYFCFPMINSARDQEAITQAVAHKRFFLGTDSAPHDKRMKYRDHGNGGCFTEPRAMSLYAEAFERMNILPILEDFASVRGARFYGMEPNRQRVQMTRIFQETPHCYYIGKDMLSQHFFHDVALQWRFDGVVA